MNKAAQTEHEPAVGVDLLSVIEIHMFECMCLTV